MLDWRESPLYKPIISTRLNDLAASFSKYLECFVEDGPFSNSQLRIHLNALRRREDFPSAADAVRDTGFADAVRDVLQNWGIGTRGTELVPASSFRSELAKLAPDLSDMDDPHIDNIISDGPRIAGTLWNLIDSVCLVTKNGRPVRNRLVSGSKALHHVLPNLVFPIDREYTQTFFGWHNPEFQYNPRECFNIIFLSIAELASQVVPSRLAGSGWLSSPAKILDNAIVGYCVKNGLESESTQYQKKRRAEFKELKDIMQRNWESGKK